MKLKYKVYAMVFVGWILFAISIYLIDIFFLNSPNFDNIKYILLATIFLSLFFTLLTLWCITSFFSGELAKLGNHPYELPKPHIRNEPNPIPLNQPIKLAYYDNLTAMPNRVFFNEILHKTISQAKRREKSIAVLIIDFDNFKLINDTYGQQISDLIIKEVSQRFKEAIRAGDTIARFSGDEFIILLDDIDHSKFASPVAEKILTLCSKPLKVANTDLILTASIGIAIFPNDGDSMQDLETHADIAMYKAKHLGGNTYQYYRHEMDIAAREHMRLENSLRHAISNNEFSLYYQPQLSLKDGTIKSVEALIRWNHPELGLVTPEKFITLAEETDLIKLIGEWALREACKTNKAWQIAGYDPIIVAVNISPQQFLHQDLAHIIQQILTEFNLEPRYLEVEITESMMLKDMKKVTHKLNEIHALGVNIAVDDFGTGYTSINYLKQFPLSALKIDQTFIHGIPFNENDAAITSGIIALGHNLGLRIVAEGVENAEQLQFLASQHCDLIQGYFLSRPLPAHKIILQFSRHGKTNEPIIEK